MKTLRNDSVERGSERKFIRLGSVVAGVLLVLALATLPADADRVSGTPKIHDSMNSQEKQRAMRTLDAELSGVRSAASKQQRFSASSVAAPLAPQLLLMERRRDKGASVRLADAWYYSYEHNETTHNVIDLASGNVISSEVVIGTQLPLVDTEITRAFDVLLASTPDRLALEQAYKDVTGKPFKDRSQVSFKAFIFHPDTVVDGLTPAARRCGVHRCAQMLIYTHDNIALDTAPVVDISTSRVLQNLELRAREIARRPVPLSITPEGAQQ